MGNRAVITTRNKNLGIYVHWNGGRESIVTFLTYCKLKGYRCPESDNYGWARLCQVIANFFGGTNSIGIGKYENLDIDNGDNGVYIIENWEIVDRLYEDEGIGWSISDEELLERLEDLNSRQPEDERIDVKLEMKKYKLCERLKSISKVANSDPEKAHFEADKLLLEFIDDYEIQTLFESIKKYYA